MSPKMSRLFLCFSIYWIFVSGQAGDVTYDDENSEEAKAIPVPNVSNIQLKNDFCFSLKCLRKISDPLEVDKVII